jgi:hypothetical protein
MSRRAVDGVALTRPSDFRKEISDDVTDRCYFDVIAIGPPTEIAGPLKIPVRVFKERDVLL